MKKLYVLFLLLIFSTTLKGNEKDTISNNLINKFGLEYRLSLPEVHNIGLRFKITEQIYLTGFAGGFWYLNRKTDKIQNPIFNFSLEGTYYAKDFLKLDNYGRSFISFQITKYKSTGHAIVVKSNFHYYTIRLGYEFDISKSFKLNFKYGVSYSDFNGDVEEDNGNGVFSWEYIPKGFEYRSIGISVIYDF